MSELVDQFHAQTFTGSNGLTLPYRLLLPHGYKPERRYPLVVVLHAQEQAGNDNRSQLWHGVAELFAEKQNHLRYQALVLAPQCPSDAAWTKHAIGGTEHVFDPTPTPAMAALQELLKAIDAGLPVDPSRRYAIGIAEGGFGVWDLIARQSGWFIGAIPLAGGGDPQTAKACAPSLIWAFHGAQDERTPKANSQTMVEATRGAGGDVRYTESVECGHNCWTKAFGLPDFLEWLFACRLRTTMIHRRQTAG